MDSSNQNMIRIEGLEFSYANSPFRLVVEQLQCASGECLAFVGPSGSGKTTLLNLVAGILKPTRGKIAIGDADIDSMSDSERRNFRIANIGFVFQDFELIDYLSVRENILLPCYINKSLSVTKELESRAAELATSMGVGDKLKRPIQRLSQGERQRVAVCRALLAQPRLLLADEPTGNLDPDNKTNIIRLLTGYAKSHDATLMVVTHDHSLLDEFDRVVDFADFLQTAVAK